MTYVLNFLVTLAISLYVYGVSIPTHRHGRPLAATIADVVTGRRTGGLADVPPSTAAFVWCALYVTWPITVVVAAALLGVDRLITGGRS